MKCDAAKELLTVYRLGDLDENTRRDVETHLESCEDCRAVLRDIEPTLDLLRDALSVSALSEERLGEQHRSRIREAMRAPKQRQGVLRWLTVGHPQMAAVAAVVVIGFIFVGLMLPAVSRARSTPYRVPKGSGVPSADIGAVKIEEKGDESGNVPAANYNGVGAFGFWSTAQSAVATKRSGATVAPALSAGHDLYGVQDGKAVNGGFYYGVSAPASGESAGELALSGTAVSMDGLERSRKKTKIGAGVSVAANQPEDIRRVALEDADDDGLGDQFETATERPAKNGEMREDLPQQKAQGGARRDELRRNVTGVPDKHDPSKGVGPGGDADGLSLTFHVPNLDDAKVAQEVEKESITYYSDIKKARRDLAMGLGDGRGGDKRIIGGWADDNGIAMAEGVVSESKVDPRATKDVSVGGTAASPSAPAAAGEATHAARRPAAPPAPPPASLPMPVAVSDRAAASEVKSAEEKQRVVELRKVMKTRPGTPEANAAHVELEKRGVKMGGGVDAGESAAGHGTVARALAPTQRELREPGDSAGVPNVEGNVSTESGVKLPESGFTVEAWTAVDAPGVSKPAADLSPQPKVLDSVVAAKSPAIFSGAVVNGKAGVRREALGADDGRPTEPTARDAKWKEDKAYDGTPSKNEADLMLAEVDRRMRRHDEAKENRLSLFGAIVATNTVASGLPEGGEKESKPATPREDIDRPRFRASGVNPFIQSASQPFSTFSIDVDTASYTLARNYMLRGLLPPPEAVRTEEFVNFFDYGYLPPVQETFKVYAECAPSRFGDGLHLMKIGVKGRRVGREEERGAVLTFLVDTSGSMDKPDRIGMIRKSLAMLVEKLGPADRVAIVQFDSQARLVLDHTLASEKKRILETINALQCSGSTHLEEGMVRAYEVAARHFRPGSENRVLILSDGVANLGTTTTEDILDKVETYRRQGIFCSVFGFGTGTYDDVTLETIANKGNGTYGFIDSEVEAKRMFVDDLAATLHTIAADVKIQVEFNPARVKQYRQLGYENRQLKKEDFRNDAVDAGEVGSGQSVTALYELSMAGAERDTIATVYIRYRRTDNGKVEEIQRRITQADVAPSFDRTDARFRLAACIAEFAEILRGSPHADGNSFERLVETLQPLAPEFSLDARVQELLRMVNSAGSLSRAP